MEPLGFSLEIICFLFGASLVAGFIDTLAGGGGLITLPALIMSGIPPLFALGTNKLQGTMGTATATLMMFRKRAVRWDDVKFHMLFAFIGAALGTAAVQLVDAELLSLVIPVVLVVIAVYFLLFPQRSVVSSEPRMGRKLYRSLVVPAVGWYDGMFGPGTGSFFALAGVALRGLRLVESTAVAKTLNFATNIASLLVFLLGGKVVWLAGLVMMGGQVCGAWLGSRFLFRINPLHLRYLVVAMCLGMLAKYLVSLVASS
ncbi:TSUP family transporter [Desulforhopalus singaporensis]|uniref:Probable membrane transporter protein n=1 Tax=Desulforhopalus singaporensis TaxID=91360 RepID=A0A1H0QBK8_9BACT|nr:TSUP family transporter [Desulforhopalus singaporensis]SDP14751.1 hypothetical protein SAMN05660330_01935 [Desulforhopalus singaporensis]